MIADTASMEFVTTATETEALLLEANLIKQLRPRYNVLLRDDKSLPYILLTGDHEAPQVVKHRGARNRQGQLLRPLRHRLGGEPDHQRPAARLSAALLQRQLLREPHPALPPVPDQALLGALHERDRDPRLPARSSPRRAPSLGQVERGAGPARRPRCRRRPRTWSSSARPATATGSRRSPPSRHAGGQHAGRRGGGRVRDRRAGRAVLRRGVLLPQLAELGQPGLLPARPTNRCAGRGAGGVRRPVLRRQAGAEGDPGLARDRGGELLAAALSTRAEARVDIHAPKRGERRQILDYALRNAKEALGRRLAETASQQKLLTALAQASGSRGAAPRGGLRQLAHHGRERRRGHDRRRAGRAS